MKNEKLAAAIKKEQKTIAGYEAKIAEYTEKLKKAKARLQQFEIMERSDKLGALTEAVQARGLSIEDVFAALESGDLLGLQEQMEASQKAEEAEASESELESGFADELGEE